MTDNNIKIKLIHESPARKDFAELPKDAKRAVLDGIEEGPLCTDEWLETLVEEAREMSL